MSASPHRLIAMLYQGARQAVALARMHMQQSNVPARCEAIGKAIRIVESGLQQSLNRDVGGELAARLDSLYSYICRRLLEANLQGSEELLIEVDRLLATLEEAWTGIGPEVARMAAQQAAEQAR